MKVELNNVNDVNDVAVALGDMDWYKGAGTYEICVGSRNMLDEVCMNDEYKTLDELQAEDAELAEYFEEFYVFEEDTWCGLKGVIYAFTEEGYSFFVKIG